jgi:hypothetical protein
MVPDAVSVMATTNNHNIPNAALRRTLQENTGAVSSLFTPSLAAISRLFTRPCHRPDEYV